MAPAALPAALPVLVAAQRDEPPAVAGAGPQERRALPVLPPEVTAAVASPALLLEAVAVALRASLLEAAVVEPPALPPVAEAVVLPVLPREAAVAPRALPPGVAVVAPAVWPLAAAEPPFSARPRQPFSSVLRFAPASTLAAWLGQITVLYPLGRVVRERTARPVLQPKLAQPPTRRRWRCRSARAI